MKSWLTLFRISAALDDRRPLPPALRARLERSPEAKQFAHDTAHLERCLREARPGPRPPVSLHGSIMRAVRNAEPSTTAAPRWWVRRWMPATATAVAVMVLLLLALDRPLQPGTPAQPGPAREALIPPGAALQLGDALTRTLPPAMVAPLAEELERLDRDLDQTARYLLASLP